MKSCQRCKGYFLDFSDLSEEERKAKIDAMFKDSVPQPFTDDSQQNGDSPAAPEDAADSSHKE